MELPISNQILDMISLVMLVLNQDVQDGDFDYQGTEARVLRYNNEKKAEMIKGLCAVSYWKLCHRRRWQGRVDNQKLALASKYWVG